MRFLVDEDLPVAAVETLQAYGHEADHVRAAGLGGKSDSEVFAAAQQRHALLLTADLGFANTVDYRPGTHCGLVVLRFPDFYRRADILHLIGRFCENAGQTDLKGALVVVSPTSIRIRRK